MTQHEHDEWIRATKASEGKWAKDPIHSQRGNLFLYKGGCVGMFIEVDHSGGMTIGTYTDALPHIGEASFRSIHTRQFNSHTHAREHLAILGITA